jgi:hypothetical protein
MDTVLFRTVNTLGQVDNTLSEKGIRFSSSVNTLGQVNNTLSQKVIMSSSSLLFQRKITKTYKII